MGFLFGQKATNSQQTPAVTQLQVQTSAYGKCIAFGFGTNRVAPEIMWYGNFQSHAQTTGGAGKGGGGGSGSTTYTYTTSIIFALGEGPIVGVRKVWIDKNTGSSIAYPQVPYPGFTIFTGSYSQSGWSYLDSLVTPSQGAIKSVLGGSYTATRNYFVQCTFTTASGETLPNAESSFQIVYTSSGPAGGKKHLLQVLPPVSPPPGATGWNIYVTVGATGTEKKQNASPLALSANYNEPSSGLLNLGTVPVTDTSGLSQKLNYRGIAYLAAANYHLGANPNLRNHNFEVQWSQDHGDDADASLVVTQILENTKYGVNFPSANVASFTTYQNYVYAAGLFISPLYTDQRSAAEIIDEILKMTNSAMVFSSGKIHIVPYGDQSITANGHTYTAPSAPQFDLDDDDFQPNQAAGGSSGSSTTDDPVLVMRRDASQMFNSLRLEYLNRSNDYSPEIAEVKDQGLIDMYGLLQDETTDGHMYCLGSAAKTAVQLMLQRQAIRNYYQFTLDARYIMLDPMDIVSVSDIGLVLDTQWVRIIEITENDDYSLTFYAEEYLQDTGSAALESFQEGDGFSVDYNIDPGNTNAPIIFEAPVALTTNGGLETWIALSSYSSTWGGADVYASTDNLTYALAATGSDGGRIVGNARTGVLLTNIASTDTTITIDLSQSYGQLSSGTAADAAAGNTLCYLDGEFISYQTATLISPYVYTLTNCVRGQYGSGAKAHNEGSAFARLDGQIFKYPHSKLQIGQTLSIKLLSFNIYGGGQQVLT